MADVKIRFIVEDNNKVENYTEKIKESGRSFNDISEESSRINKQSLMDLKNQADSIDRINKLKEQSNRIQNQSDNPQDSNRIQQDNPKDSNRIQNQQGNFQDSNRTQSQQDNFQNSNRIKSASIDELQDAAEEVAKGMIRSSRELYSSGKEVLADINSQITAIERKNKLEESLRIRKVENQVRSGDISKTEGEEQVSRIRNESSEDKLQTQLLREVISAIKDTARKEIREDKTNIIKQIQNNDKLRDIGISNDSDEFEQLKKTIQKQQVDDIEKISRSHGINRGNGGNGSTTVELASRAAGSAASSNNQFYAMAGLLAAVPVIGGALSGVVGRAFSKSGGYQTQLGRNVAISGGIQEDYKGFGEDYTEYGYTMEDALSTRFNLARAKGTSIGLDVEGNLQLQRGLGIGQGTLLGMERLQRNETGGGSTKSNIQMMISALRSTGTIKGNDTAILPEYLEELTSLGQQQLKVLGEVDTGVNIKTIASLSNLDKSFKNPDILRGIISSIKGGLVQAPNSQLEAMQFAALSRVKPDASLWELEKVRAAPFAEGNKEYLKNYLGSLERAGGNQEGFFRNVMGAFKQLSPQMAEKVAIGYQSGNLDNVTENIIKGGGVDLKQQANDATAELARATSKFDNTFSVVGDKLVTTLSLLQKQIEYWLADNKKTLSSYEESAKINQDVADEIAEGNKSRKGVIKALGVLSENIMRLPMNQF